MRLMAAPATDSDTKDHKVYCIRFAPTNRAREREGEGGGGEWERKEGEREGIGNYKLTAITENVT